MTRWDGWRLATILLACAPVCVSKFYYPNFLDTSGLILRGATRKRGKCLILTDFLPNESGAAWYKREIRAGEGFFAAFNIRMKPPPGNWPNSSGKYVANRLARHSGGGEGMVFVMHKSDRRYRAIGQKGSGLGYAGLKDAIVVEFDTLKSVENKDPNGNHVSLHLPREGEKGTSAFEFENSRIRTDISPLCSGEMHTVQVSYDGHVLKIFLNDLVNPILQTEVKIEGDYWMGFTASTGEDESIASQHQVCDWYFETNEDEEKCDPGFAGTSCMLDTSPSVSECLAQNTCTKCLRHVRDCRWCSSQKRCISGAVNKVEDLKRSFCDDPTSLLSDEGECLLNGHDFVSMWNNFMTLMLALLLFSVVGKLVSARSISINGRPNARPCFKNSLKMYHLFSLLESTCAGALFAVVFSYSVNYSLFLLTTYTLYSMGLGLLLVVIGSLILWQTLSHYFDGGREQSLGHCILLCVSSIYLSACGVICFMLESNFAKNMSQSARVTVYAAIGISLCFSIVFIFVDLYARTANICRRQKIKPLAQHAMYTRLLVVSACISGMYFGYTFGVMQLDDENASYVELALKEQNYYCYPLGCLLGGMTAFINRFMALPVLDEKTQRHEMQDGL